MRHNNQTTPPPFAPLSLQLGVISVFALCSILGCGAKSEPEAAKAVQAAESLAAGLREGQSHVICDAWTDSQREDVNRLVHRFAEKAPTDLWQKGFRVVALWGRALKEKREFALNCPQVKRGHNKLEKHGEDLSNFLIHLAESDLSSLDKLKTADPRDLFKQLDPYFMKAGTAIISLMPVEEERQLALATYRKGFEAITKADFKLSDHGEDWAVVESRIGGRNVDRMRFLKDGPRWVPEFPAGEWNEAVIKADAWLNEFDPNRMPQLAFAGAMIDAFVISGLEQILAAETQAEFDAIFEASTNPMLPVFFYAADKKIGLPQ